jgi:hypothetical protein
MKKALLLAALLAVVWFFNRKPAESPPAYTETSAEPRMTRRADATSASSCASRRARPSSLRTTSTSRRASIR